MSGIDVTRSRTLDGGREKERRLASALKVQTNRGKAYRHRGVSPEYEASKFVYDEASKTFVPARQAPTLLRQIRAGRHDAL